MFSIFSTSNLIFNSWKSTFITLTKCTPKNIQKLYESIDFTKTAIINHKNLFFIYIKIENTMEIQFLDMMGNKIIEISFKELSSKNNSPDIIYLEKLLEGEEIFHFTENEKDLLISKVEIYGNSKSNKLKNITHKELWRKIESSNCSLNFKSNVHSLDNNSDINDLINNFGLPHRVINFSDGYQILVFLGVSKKNTENSKSQGCFLIKINGSGNISGIYKFFQIQEANELPIIINKISQIDY